MCSFGPLVEAPRRALGQAGPEGFDRSSNVVDQLRAASYQRLPGADDRQMSLGALTPVLEWVEQLRVHSSQASQVLSVYFICLAFVGVDEPKSLRELAAKTS
jgi:hypothetical protein